MVSVRTLFFLVLAAMLVTSEAAPQFGGFRGGRRGFRGGRRGFGGPIINTIGNFLGGGGRSNSRANANVIRGQQGNNGITQVNANVVTQNRNSPGGVSLSGGLALASNLQLNSPFGNINLSNAQAQTVNRGFNIFGRRR
ncbi:uncharacterized protein LOC122381516 [Amphibalanus amphitrite]|uniref:uncharacterized protein LOC122381516 n=1 Tax=Amphibalanus amphitrite TaxID=1232801 RepID=UPI001C921244|nr:uncharacterized protein LOC122381516 [Amphibalanus amphitrite]